MAEIDEVASRLRAAIRNIGRRADALKDKNSPTRSEQSVLAWLEDHGPTTPRTLSDGQHVRPQSMQQTLDSLERRRWIKRADHPTDRRQILISPTASGRKALLKGRELRQAWLVDQIGRLACRDRQTLNDAISILERFLESSNPESK